MVLEIICGPHRSYLAKGVYKTVYVSTCMEVGLIPSEMLKSCLKVNDFSRATRAAAASLLAPGQHCPSPGKVTLRKHSVMDKLQKQHLASFPVSSMSHNIDQVF